MTEIPFPTAVQTSAAPAVATRRLLVAFAAYFVVSLVHLGALFIAADDVARISKLLLMPALLVAFLWALPTVRSQIAVFGGLGIVFSWLGDVLLGAPGSLSFVIGLGCFLLAHVAYLLLFLRSFTRARLRPVIIAYVAWWVVFVVILAPHTGSLLAPVALYGVVLGTMAYVGLGCNRWIAVGGVLFIASDSILGLHKFLPGFDFPQISFVIMLTYIAAEGLIAWGAVSGRGQRPGR